MPIINLPSQEQYPKLPILKLLLVYALETRRYGLSDRIEFYFGKDAADIVPHSQAIQLLQKIEKFFLTTVEAYYIRQLVLTELIEGYIPDRSAFKLSNMVLNKLGKKAVSDSKEKFSSLGEVINDYLSWLNEQEVSKKHSQFEDELLKACENNNFSMDLLKKGIREQLPLTVKSLFRLLPPSEVNSNHMELKKYIVNYFDVNSLRIYLKDFYGTALDDFLYEQTVPNSEENLFSYLILTQQEKIDPLQKLLTASPYLLESISNKLFLPIKSKNQTFPALLWLMQKREISHKECLIFILNKNEKLIPYLLEEKLFEPVAPRDCSYFYYMLSNYHHQPLIQGLLKEKKDVWATIPLSILLEKNSKKVPFLAHLLEINPSHLSDIMKCREQEIVNKMPADYLFENYNSTILFAHFLQMKQYNLLRSLFEKRPEMYDSLKNVLVKKEMREFICGSIECALSQDRLGVARFLSLFNDEKSIAVLKLLVSCSERLFQDVRDLFINSSDMDKDKFIRKWIEYNDGCKILSAIIMDVTPKMVRRGYSFLSEKEFLRLIHFPERHALLKTVYKNHPKQIEFIGQLSWYIVAHLSCSKEGLELVKIFYHHKPEIVAPLNQHLELFQREPEMNMSLIYRLTMTEESLNLFTFLLEKGSTMKGKWFDKFKSETLGSKLAKAMTADILFETAGVRGANTITWYEHSQGASCLHNLLLHEKGHQILHT